MQTAYGSRSAMSLAGDAVILCLLAAIAPLAVSAQNNWLQLSWAQLPFMGSSPPGRFSSACAWDAVKSELYCAGGSTGPVGDFNEMRDLWYVINRHCSGGYLLRASRLISKELPSHASSSGCGTGRRERGSPPTRARRHSPRSARLAPRRPRSHCSETLTICLADRYA